MSDGLMGIAADCCSHDFGRPSWGRVIFKLVVLYGMLATACWIECRFRSQGIELDASVEIVGGGPKNSRLVRYRFQDPMTGLPRMNTVSVPEHMARILIHHVAAVQLANAVVAQTRPLANGEGAGFVADQPQRQIQSLAVPCIAVIGHSHGRLLWCNYCGFGLKKNLTEINHKVSVVAKWFRCLIAAAFAVKCTGAA